MTYGGYGGGSGDPFGEDPFGGTPSGQGFPSGGPGFPPPVASQSYPGNQSYPPLTPEPQGEVNTLSTLSIVFAFVLAPAGAILGHVALHQIRQRNERGRERALIGLTLSYVIIVAAIIALVVWLLWADDSTSAPTAVSTTTTTTTINPTPTRLAPLPPITTVITAPPTERQTVTVEELRVGDCVEVQQNEPVPGRPDMDYIAIYRTACQARDGVLQVNDVVTDRSVCQGYALLNKPETLFACVSDYKG